MLCIPCERHKQTGGEERLCITKQAWGGDSWEKCKQYVTGLFTSLYLSRIDARAPHCRSGDGKTLLHCSQLAQWVNGSHCILSCHSDATLPQTTCRFDTVGPLLPDLIRTKWEKQKRSSVFIHPRLRWKSTNSPPPLTKQSSGAFIYSGELIHSSLWTRVRAPLGVMESIFHNRKQN